MHQTAFGVPNKLAYEHICSVGGVDKLKKLSMSFDDLSQGLYQLLESKVTIRCRKQDFQMIQVSQLATVCSHLR